MARGKKQPILMLNPDQEALAVDKLKRLFLDRFELELGSFEVTEVLEFLTTEIAPLYYNKAVADVQEVLHDRFASIEIDLWALEKN